MKRNIKPFEEGWEKLSIEERIEIWLEANKSEIEHRAEDFKIFLHNFSASYSDLDANSLKQLKYEIRKPEFEYWTEEDKELLVDGVFSMYNTTPGLLGLKLFNDEIEGYKNN